MKTRTEQIHELLLENRIALIQADQTSQKKPNGICFDGIVCEEVFVHQRKKVMFLLKETNGNTPDGTSPDAYCDWDYRHWLEYQQFKNQVDETSNDCKLYRTFYNLAMWVDIFYSVLDNRPLSYQAYIDSGRFSDSTLRENLGKTAVVNLKKTWGGAETQWSSLNSYLEAPVAKDVLHQEIAIIDPDVIICGSAQVFDFAKGIFAPNTSSHIMVDGISVPYFTKDNRLFISFFHPACRKSRETVYNFASNVFQQLLAK